MIAEQKSFGHDLAAADGQAEDYLLGGDITPNEMPRYIVSSDFNTVQITDLESPLDPPFEFNISKLPLHISRFAFLSGYAAPKRQGDKQTEVSIRAARAMGALYDALLGDVDASGEGHDAQHAAIFMTRLLFLMFGDDADGLWDRGLFLKFVEERTSEDGSDVGAQIAYLFQILDTPRGKRSERLDAIEAAFPYVNGGLFKERIDIPTFDSGMRNALLKACDEDWSNVSPAIFGSLFQGMSSTAKRRAHGEHYTTEVNILKTLRPLFLDGLEQRLQEAWNSDQALTRLRDSLEGMQYFDPAAGSGNFIIVAYREMRDLELRLLVRLRQLRGQSNDYSLDATWDLKVTPDQFGGIEINWWPAKIAETAMFLVDHQANQRMAETLGAAPERLPITIAARIIHADALTMDWADAFPPTPNTYVFGNPPFLGKKVRDEVQRDTMHQAWTRVHGKYSKQMDFVTSWFAAAMTYFSAPGAKGGGHFAFVSTNSITQGEPVESLFGTLARFGWRIRFAYRNFPWKSEATGAAAVHCVIIGCDRELGGARQIFTAGASGDKEETVIEISPYLTEGAQVPVRKRMTPLSPTVSPALVGSQPSDGGNLILDRFARDEALADPIAARYVRRYVGADELIGDKGRWCLWLRDANLPEARRSPLIAARLAAVTEMRNASTYPSTLALAASPHLFWNDQQPSQPYICIPAHFSGSRKYATVARFEPDVIASNANFTALDPDGLLFATISSAMFLAWQRLVGGRIKSDLRFGNTLTWNTFPLPELTASERQKIITAGTSVLEARASLEGQSLADMYDPLAMDASLLYAHRSLDRLVDRAFGFAKHPSETQRQQRLFERYVQMVSHPAASPTSRAQSDPTEL